MQGVVILFINKGKITFILNFSPIIIIIIVTRHSRCSDGVQNFLLKSPNHIVILKASNRRMELDTDTPDTGSWPIVEGSVDLA